MSDVEEHTGEANQERHDDQVEHGQGAENSREGNRGEQHGPGHIAADENRPACPSIEPGAVRQAD
jgi:hypothetical protein